MMTFWLAAPLLAIGFIAGIAISLVQIATSIQDNAVSSIPRLRRSWRACCCCCPGCCRRSWLTRSRCSGRPGPVCPARSLTLLGRDAVRLPAGAGAGRRRAGVRAAAGRARALREPARVALALGFTWRCRPRWPAVDGASVTAGMLAGWVAAEAALGTRHRDLRSAIVLEAFALAAQILRACRPDMRTPRPSIPTREADSGVLLVFAQLMAGMLFFALGLDREVLRLFAQSLDRSSAGRVRARHAPSAEAIIRLGVELFSRSACGWRCRWSRCC